MRRFSLRLTIYPTPHEDWAAMTERLYYGDSYLKRFEATVLEHGAGGRIYLDRSAFYPTSGGQPYDTGSLRPSADASAPPFGVLDVIDEGERVAHVLAEPDAERLSDGARVSGELDWARRFDHMQQHTGQHLLSAVFQDLLGCATLSVHFGADAATLDLDASALAPEQLLAVEQRANAAVFENRPVTAGEEASASGLRKESARSGPLRIVTIADLDRSACGGTHVARTGEIGPILLRKQEKARRGTRVEFVCGGRAVRRARADYDALARLGGLLSTSVDGVAEVMSKRLAELERDAKALRSAREVLDGYRANELYAAARAEAGSGVAIGLEHRTQGSLQELRGLALAFVANPGAAFLAALDQPASVLLATSADTGLDAGALLKEELARRGGRGGGSARLAQGTLENATALADLLAALQVRLAGGVASRPS